MDKAEIARIREALSSTDKWPSSVKKAAEMQDSLKTLGYIITIGSGIFFLVVMFLAAGGFHLGGFLIALVGVGLLYGLFWIIDWFANRNVMRAFAWKAHRRMCLMKSVLFRIICG